MDATIKKTALRMIPYGLYIITAGSTESAFSAASVNWVTQASFNPPLLALGIKADTHTHHLVKEKGLFNVNILGKGQQSIAFTFFKTAELRDNTISGEPFHIGTNGVPILDNAPAYLECRVVQMIEGKGDHSLVLAEVTEAGMSRQPEGRPDEATLWLKDLGEKIFYGG